MQLTLVETMYQDAIKPLAPQVLGNYKIIGEVGAGSMGAVYRALDLLLDREVALKALRPELTTRSDVIGRFREEAKLQARLNHPNVAQLYTLFPHGHSLFTVMEFVNGPTLDAIIRRAGRIPLSHALPLFLQVLNGMEHAHRMGIIHRDLKPSNIMLNCDGLVKVTDFGIARMLGSARMTRDGSIIGTLEYMSPESVLGEEMDCRSDLYSLGCVLFEMLAGDTPFRNQSEYELMRAQIETAPPSVRTFSPEVPVEIEKAILKVMAKDPGDRYSSVAAFADVLRKHAEGMPPVDFNAWIAPDPNQPLGNFDAGSSPAGATRLAGPATVAGVRQKLQAWLPARDHRFRYLVSGIIAVTAVIVSGIIAVSPGRPPASSAGAAEIATGKAPQEPAEYPSKPPAQALAPRESASEPEHFRPAPASPPATSRHAERPANGEAGLSRTPVVSQIAAAVRGPETASKEESKPGLEAVDPVATLEHKALPASAPATAATTPQPPARNADAEAREVFAQAQAKLLNREYEQAGTLFGRAARLKPEWSEPWVERARIDTKLGRYTETVEDCTLALRLNPANPVALNLRGYALYSLNRIAEAIADFDEAIGLKPDYDEAYSNRGNAKWRLKDKQGADQDFARANALKSAKAGR